MANLRSALPETRILAYPRQRAVPCLFMRGGSSRGGFFLAGDMPADRKEWAALLLAVYGSPDVRQIDGIGGADALTSKAAIVGPATRSDADVDYTFAQVSLETAQIGVGGTCGNMLAAVGPFAILRGLVAPAEPDTVVRIHATNTGQVITARVPIVEGLPAIDGECSIPGVPGRGARIGLDFGNCVGAVSGVLLPTGHARDEIDIEGTKAQVSLVDAATPFIFVRADDIGARGTESAAEIAANTDLSRRLELVRGWAATILGLASDPEAARTASPNLPRVIMVAPPQAYTTPDGETVRAADADLCVRQMSMQRPHKALAVTGSVCTAVAAAVAGTTVAEAASRPQNGTVRLGHPSGVLQVRARVRKSDSGYVIEAAEIERTARLIMAGTVYVPAARVAALTDIVEVSGAKAAGD